MTDAARPATAPGWSATEVLRPKRGPDESPLGPIRLSAPVHEVIISTAEAMETLVRQNPVPSDLIHQLLGLMNDITVFLEPLITDYVTLLRSWGSPWEEIATALRISPESAWEKYRHVDGTRVRGVVDAPPPAQTPSAS